MKEESKQLRSAITQFVLNAESGLPDVESVRHMRAEYHRLMDEVGSANQQAKRLSEAKGQIAPLENELQQIEQELAKSREGLTELYRPLGKAAFEAYLVKQMADHPALADRVAVHEKIEHMRQESAALAPTVDAKLLDKAKAKAQQLAIMGKIKLEQAKIGKLEQKIGQQLVSEQEEESVRGETTGQILDQIAQCRADIAEKQQQAEQTTTALESKKQQLCQELELPAIENTRSLDAQISQNKKLTSQLQKKLVVLQRDLPDRLIADESLTADSQLGVQVNELREIESQLKSDRPLATAILNKAKPLSTPVKAVIGGGVATCGLIVLFCGLGMLGFFGDDTEPKEDGQLAANNGVSIDLGGLNTDLRGIRGSLTQQVDDIARESLERQNRDREAYETDRKRIEAEQEKERQRRKQQTLAKLEGVKKTNLAEMYDYFVPSSRSRAVSQLPARPRGLASVRVFEKPVRTLKTSGDEITSIAVLPNGELVQYGMHGFPPRSHWRQPFILFGVGNNVRTISLEDLSIVPVDDEFVDRPFSLDYYRQYMERPWDSFYTLLNPAGMIERQWSIAFRDCYGDAIRDGYMLHRSATILSDGTIMARMPAETAKYAEESPWQNRLERYIKLNTGSTPLGVWEFRNNRLTLIDVFAVGLSGVEIKKIDIPGGVSDDDSVEFLYAGTNVEAWPVNIVEATAWQDKLVVLAGYPCQNLRTNSVISSAYPRGDQLQVWSKGGMIGSAFIRPSFETQGPHKIAVHPDSGIVAVLHDKAAQIFDATKIKQKNMELDALKTLVSPFPNLIVPDEAGHVAVGALLRAESASRLEFSPNGETLLVALPVHDPEKDEKVTRLAFYDTRTWELKSEVRTVLFPGYAGFSPNGQMYAVHFTGAPGRTLYHKTAQVWSVENGDLVREFSSLDANTVLFIDDDRLLTGGMSRTDAPSYSDEAGNVKTEDIGPRNINIWKISTGALWGRLTLRDVLSVAVSPDGKYLLTGKSKYLIEPALLEKWDLSKPDKIVPFEGEFDIARRSEFEAISAQYNRGALMPAPFVTKTDYDKLRIGMTYEQVIRVLLGVGKFEAEVVEVDVNKFGFESMVRATVTYDAMGSPNAQYQLIFEGDLADEPYKIKLTKKSKKGN